MPSPAVKKCQPTIARRLLAWYDRNRRDMPWRRTRDPYRIWLSEMMLQQTQVATVTPYYGRFVRRFPTVRDLADAPLEEVLRLWAGLGYYARARNLHRAAQVVSRELGGVFPDTVEGLLRLPGVGPYSAGAIASIAFDRRAAVVDGNVIRVLGRVFAIREDVSSSRTKKRIWEIAEGLLPRRRCGDFNQAVMELGATVCLPGAAARCEACPLRRNCRAQALGLVGSLPRKGKRTKVEARTHVVAAVSMSDKWLVVQRPADGLWGGLWELPTTETPGDAATAAKRLAGEWTGRRSRVSKEPFCDLSQQLSHRTIRFIGHICRLEDSKSVRTLRGAPGKWVALEAMDKLGMSRAMTRVVEQLASALSRDRD